MNEIAVEALTDIEKGRFSEFADKVKASLNDKLRDHPQFKSNVNQVNKYNDMKDIFNSIGK